MTSTKGTAAGGSIDPSRLHLRKAARGLNGPGATWRPTADSARALTKHHYVHRRQIDGNAMSSLSEEFLESRVQSNNVHDCSCREGGCEKAGVKEKERVFLYNWRSKRSGGEVSRPIGEEDAEGRKGDGSFLARDDDDGVRNDDGNESKSDAYLSERSPAKVFRRKDGNFTPFRKKTSKRSNYNGTGFPHHDEKLLRQMIMSRFRGEGSLGYGFGRDDVSDGSEYSRVAAVSPLLAKLKSSAWGNSPSKLLSYVTPALSKSSCNTNSIRNRSTAGSWDATTASLNDADDDVDNQLDLPGRNGCGIPCYWSRRSTPKSRVWYGSCCSPSLSDTLRRKGSHILCGSQSVHRRRHHRSDWRRLNSKIADHSFVPHLRKCCKGQGGSSIGSEDSDEKPLTNLKELDLEASSRLDGRRWSMRCRSRGELEPVATDREEHRESPLENIRGISHSYRPMFFEDLVGQNVVVQSLSNAISRGRIAPIYLFQGPHGTGKTSMARIFAAALNCLSIGKAKPCGACRECADFVSGKSSHLIVVDGSDQKGSNNIKYLLKSLASAHSSVISQFKVFVVDECHLLPSKTWLTFLRLLEKPLTNAVIVLTTTDVNNVPRTVLSRCQKHIFSKISSSDIATRLSKIATAENMDVESDALDLIAMNADGLLRDAETMLDQLSLFGKRIDIPLVNELVGVASDEKLLDLLRLAMSSNATETVVRARELMESGVDPIVLMSQMATLIVDVIAGTTYSSGNRKHGSFFTGGCLSERELNCLKHALALLTEAEKHLRGSSERSTWFTATLLQLGSLASPNRQSTKAIEEDHIYMLRESIAQKPRFDAHSAPDESDSPNTIPRSEHRNSTSKEYPISGADAASHEPLPVSQGDHEVTGPAALTCSNLNTLDKIWLQCIEKCHSKTLRQLLHSHGRLVSISKTRGGFVAYVVFRDKNIKTRAEGFLRSITSSFEIILQHNVEVKIILLPESSDQAQIDENESTSSTIAVSDEDPDSCAMPMKTDTESVNVSKSHQVRPPESYESNIPEKQIESIIHQQKLETAWMQALEKGTPVSLNHLKPERKQILPRVSPLNGQQAMHSMDDGPSQQWEDELNHELKALKFNDRAKSQKVRIAKRMVDRSPISPSVLHSSSFTSNLAKDNMGYESGSGALCCSGMFCWNNAKPHRRRAKAKR